MTTPTKFWDKIADKYAQQPIADEAAYQRKLETTRRYLTPESDVLEIGCGTGGTARMHAPYVRSVRATDYSPSMISIARDRLWESSLHNVTLEVAAAEDVRAPDESYDAILALSILHLVLDRQAVLRRVVRMLKPGGFLVTSTVCARDMSGIIPRILLPLGSALRILPHVKSLRAAEIRADILAMGLEVVEDWQSDSDKSLFLIARKPEGQSISSPDMSTYAEPVTRTPLMASGGPKTSTFA